MHFTLQTFNFLLYKLRAMHVDHRVLVRLSTDYSRLKGKFLRITTSFATNQEPQSRNPSVSCIAT